MTQKLYLLISGSVFALMGIFHLIRIISQWSLQIGAVGIPQWPSWLAIIAGTILSIWAFRLAILSRKLPRSSQ